MRQIGESFDEVIILQPVGRGIQNVEPEYTTSPTRQSKSEGENFFLIS